MVPLIAMDELPIHVQIGNVPRLLSSFDIPGMTSVGVHDSRHRYYAVESINSPRPTPINSPRPTLLNSIHAPASYHGQTSGLRASKPDLGRGNYVPFPPATTTTPLNASNAEGSQLAGTNSTRCTSTGASVTDESKGSDTTATHRHSTPNAASATAAAPGAWRQHAQPLDSASQSGAKEYCSYWLRRGECDYAQQGCIYKHEMPEDLETLERLGFRDLPAWYRQIHGMGSLLVNGGRNTPSFGVAAASGPKRVGEGTRRMLRSHLSGRAGGFWQHHRANLPIRVERVPVAAPVAAGKQTKEKAQPKPAAEPEQLITLDQQDEQDEVQSKDLAQKYAALTPERPCLFVHDLDSDTFSNGEDTMDPMMKAIRDREQAGWEEAQKLARAKAAAAAAAATTPAAAPTAAAVPSAASGPVTPPASDKKQARPAAPPAAPAAAPTTTPPAAAPTAPAAARRSRRHGRGCRGGGGGGEKAKAAKGKADQAKADKAKPAKA